MAQYLHMVVVALGMTLALVAQVALQFEISDDHQSQPASYQLLAAQSGPASARVSQKQQQVANDLFPSVEPNLVSAANGDSNQNSNNNNNNNNHYDKPIYEAVDRPQARVRAALDTASGRAVINGNHATYVEPPADFRPIIYDSERQHPQAASSAQQHQQQKKPSSSVSSSAGGKNSESFESSDQLAASMLIPITTNSLSRHQQQQQQSNHNGARTKHVPAGQRQQTDNYPLDSGDSLDTDDERDEEQLNGGAFPLKPSVGRWTDWHDMSIEPDLASSDTQLAQSSSRGVYYLSPQSPSQPQPQPMAQQESADVGKMSATVSGGGPLSQPSSAVPYKNRYQQQQQQQQQYQQRFDQWQRFDDGRIKGPSSSYQQVQPLVQSSAVFQAAKELPQTLMNGAIKYDDGGGQEPVAATAAAVRLMPLNTFYASNLIRLQQHQPHHQHQHHHRHQNQQQRPQAMMDYRSQEAQYFGGETQFNRNFQQRQPSQHRSSAANLLQASPPLRQQQRPSEFYFFAPTTLQHPPPPSPMHFLMAHNQDQFASRSQSPTADTSDSQPPSPSLSQPSPSPPPLKIHHQHRHSNQRRSKSKMNAEVRLLHWSAPLKQQQHQQSHQAHHSLYQPTGDFSGAGKQVSAPLVSAPSGPSSGGTSSAPVPVASSAATAGKKPTAALVMHHHAGHSSSQSALDARVFSLSAPKSLSGGNSATSGAGQLARQPPSGGSSSTVASAASASASVAPNRNGTVATQAASAAKRVLKRRRIKTLLPVGLSSWFLGGIRDLDAKHWQLPADVMSKLAANDIDLQHPADGAQTGTVGDESITTTNAHDSLAAPGFPSSSSPSSSLEQAGPALPSSATQRVPNSQLIPR